MEIHYKTTKLEKLLTNTTALIKKYGKQAGLKVARRIREIKASDCLEDLPHTARAHPWEPKEEEIFSIDVLKHKHSTRMTLKPFGNKYDIKDYGTITEVEIQAIIVGFHS
jgi:hypothetical protein